MPFFALPSRLRTLLLGAACLLPLAGCDGGARDAHAEGNAQVAGQLAEREARHFELYMQYRAVFDRPRRLLSDALQDDVDLPSGALHFLSGYAGACSMPGAGSD